MIKLSTVIADKRNILFVVYIALFIFSFIASGWVNVCNDITEYLPEHTETKKGLSIMEDEFITYATSKAMVTNITYEEAEKIEDILKALPSVSMVDFDDTPEHYSQGCALFDVTLTAEEGEEAAKAGYKEIREALKDYNVYYTESDYDKSDTLAGEMSTVLLVAAVIIVVVLLFTSRTYMEVPVLLITFVAAAIINKGTNFVFGEISFISNSVTSILQLALSIDYAIILIHHYSEERERRDQRDAVIHALATSIPEISASSLTTISGLMALMFMQFKIGFDMGMCLIKAILFSLLCVFTLMPCLLMLMGKYIDKTHHKTFLPDVSFWGSVVYKLRIVIPPLFVGVLVLAYVLSAKCPFVYNDSLSETEKKNEAQVSEEMIEKVFGTENFSAFIVPKGDYDNEKRLIAELESMDEVRSTKGLSSVEAKDGYVLTDKLSPRQFAEMTDIDIDLAKMLYAAYATDNEEYSKLLGNLNDFGVPLIDMFTFVYDMKEDGYVELDDDMEKEIDDLYVQLDSAKKQLLGENYTRILVYLNLPLEGEETFAFIDKAHDIINKYYDTGYVVGNSTSSYDLAASFDTDNIIVNVLSIVFVLIVLFFTFKSAGLPVLLIAVIEGSVWLNFSTPTVTDNPIFFMSYLIVSSIQMGANIDYAIVISSRYMQLKNIMPIKEAMRETINFAFPTILTSGSILSAAGYLIGKLSTDPSVVSIGLTLCRGTLISMLLVMCVLPEILLLGDTIIEKTRIRFKKPVLTTKDTGRFIVNGHLSGYVSGYINADVKGIVRGDVNARIDINNIEKEEGSEEE